MGMKQFEVSELGDLKLQVGALTKAKEDVEPISLDSPSLFVVDTKNEKEFEDWFHEIGNETSYTIPLMINRISEIEEKIGMKIAFYWEEEITGDASEGEYSFDTSKIEKAYQDAALNSEKRPAPQN